MSIFNLSDILNSFGSVEIPFFGHKVGVKQSVAEECEFTDVVCNVNLQNRSA